MHSPKEPDWLVMPIPWRDDQLKNNHMLLDQLWT